MLTIKKSQTFCAIYKNIHFVFYLFLLILLFVGYFYNLFGFIFASFFIFALCMCVITDKFLRKTAWRIDLDIKNNIVIFHMLKVDEVIKYDISKLCELIINGHMYFKFGRHKIIWHSPNLKMKNEVIFFNAISRLIKVKFGWLSYLDKNVISLKNQLESREK